MTREKITFSPNQATAVVLDGIGTAQDSTSGAPEFRYFLQQNRIMWVPPEVHEQIADLQDAAQEQKLEIAITKRQAKRGAPVSWLVEQIEDEPRNGYSNQPAPLRDVRHPNGTWTQEPTPQPQPRREPTAQAQAPAPQPRTPQPAAVIAASAPELPVTVADRMAACLKDAIDLCRGARQYEPNIAWSAGDVRALAATLFIESSKAGRV